MNIILRRTIYLVLCMILAFSSFASAAPKFIPADQLDKMERKFTPLDISKAANMGFVDTIAGDGVGGWTDQGAENDLREFTLTGLNRLAGVDFYIIDPKTNDGKTCIVLRGQNVAAFPTSAEIPVNAKGTGVYFLHACAWTHADVGRYRFVYEDGSEAEVNIRGRIDVFNWWGGGSSETAVTGWSGSNLSTDLVSLYVFACENPEPGKTISKIIAETDGDKSFLMIVAATLCEGEMYLPSEPDLANPDKTDWYPYSYPLDPFERKGTPLDVSFLLDAPAGKHGFVRIKGEDFVFEDGTEVKFWATNLPSSTYCFDYEDLENYAEFIAQAGFNMVRMHALDSFYLIAPYGLFADPKSVQRLNPVFMDKVCYFINECKKRGIYIYMDTITYFPLHENDNVQNVTGMKEPRSQGASGGGYGFFDERFIEIKEIFTAELLNWYNPYTGMHLKDDPAVVMIGLENENSLLHHPEFTSDYHLSILRKKYNQWLKEKYKTQEELARAWGDELKGGENLENGTVEVYGYTGRLLFSGQRRLDNIEFLCDVQTDYIEHRKNHIRGLGTRALVAGITTWGNDMFATRYSNARAADIVDYHTYWEHPTSGSTMKAGTTWPINKPTSMLQTSSLGVLGRIFNTRVYGKPFTVSEVNNADPVYMSETLPLIAAYCGLQGIHPMYFNFGKGDFLSAVKGKLLADSIVPENNGLMFSDLFGGYENPVAHALMPASSMIFLRDVKEADRGYYLSFTHDDMVSPKYQTVLGSASIGMIGRTGTMIHTIASDPDYNDNDVLYLAKQAEKNKTPFVSITGEMSTDIQNGRFMLNTARSQTFAGFAKDVTLYFDDIEMTLGNEYATVSLNSLSDKPIWDSDKLLLTTAARFMNSGQVLEKNGSKVLVTGTAPVLVEPVVGNFVLKTRDDVEIYALDVNGKRKKAIATRRNAQGFVEFTLEKDNCTMHYEIVRVKKFNGVREANPHISLGSLEVKDLFEDLTGFESCKKQIERLVLLGIMNGTSDTTFSPNDKLLQNDAINAAQRVADSSGVYLTEQEIMQELGFTYVPPVDGKEDQSQYAEEKSKYTRAEAAVILYNIMWSK